MRFLVIEDHLSMAEQLREGFSARGYTVNVVGNGEDALHEAREFDYTLAVVDLGLPGLSGLELIKRLRTEGNRVPIVVLTARDDVASVVEAMEAGADDYLKKPVYIEELFAHIDAVLRRTLNNPDIAESRLECGPLCLDLGRREITRDNEQVALTRAEYEIVEFLWRQRGKVLSKKQIADSYQRDPASDASANSVEGLIGRIKRKLDPERDLQPIETVRGMGYRFRED